MQAEQDMQDDNNDDNLNHFIAESKFNACIIINKPLYSIYINIYHVYSKEQQLKLLATNALRLKNVIK